MPEINILQSTSSVQWPAWRPQVHTSQNVQKACEEKENSWSSGSTVNHTNIHKWDHTSNSQYADYQYRTLQNSNIPFTHQTSQNGGKHQSLTAQNTHAKALWYTYEDFQVIHSNERQLMILSDTLGESSKPNKTCGLKCWPLDGYTMSFLTTRCYKS